jgi:hypothetical protein
VWVAGAPVCAARAAVWAARAGDEAKGKAAAAAKVAGTVALADASIPDFWDRIDPCAVLERLNAVHQGDA